MKNCIFILIFPMILISNEMFSQGLKLYKGNYDVGKATYSYYENSDFQRIFDGDFKYSDGKCSVNGSFKQNNKEGNWTYYNDYFSKGKTFNKISGSYKNGLKIGLWKFTFSENGKQKNSVLNFINDSITGKIKINNLVGEIKSGKFIGNWNYKFNDVEYIVSFDNNVVTKFVERRISDGRINVKYTPNIDSITRNEISLDLKSDLYMKIPFNDITSYSSEYSGIYLYDAEGNNFERLEKNFDNFFLLIDVEIRKLFSIYCVLIDEPKLSKPEFLMIKKNKRK